MHLNKESIEEEKLAVAKTLSKRVRQLEHKASKLNSFLEACERWAELQHEADLLKYSLPRLSAGASSIEVEDFLTGEPRTLLLDPSRPPFEQMKALYKKAKKLERGKLPLLNHLKETREEIESLVQSQAQIACLQTEEEIRHFKQRHPFLFALPKCIGDKKKEENSASAYCREFFSSTGALILVGKNAKGNDELTFKRAKGNDFWLHVRGYSGSHVIIPHSPKKEIDAQTLQEACQLALYFSGARPLQEAEVCVTRRKWVSRRGRKAGQVQIANERSLATRLHSEMLKKWHLSL